MIIKHFRNYSSITSATEATPASSQPTKRGNTSNPACCMPDMIKLRIASCTIGFDKSSVYTWSETVTELCLGRLYRKAMRLEVHCMILCTLAQTIFLSEQIYPTLRAS